MPIGITKLRKRKLSLAMTLKKVYTCSIDLRRRYWEHPINKKEDLWEHSFTLCKSWEQMKSGYCKYFRKTVKNLDLLNLIHNQLKKVDTNMRKATPSPETGSNFTLFCWRQQSQNCQFSL